MEQQLQAAVGQAVEGFRDITLNSLEGVLSAQERLLTNQFLQEKAQLDAIVEQQETEIAQLQAELERTKGKRLKSNKWSFIMFDKVNGERMISSAFAGWVYYAKWQRRKKRMTNIVLRFYARRLRGTLFKAWKTETHLAYRANKCRRYQTKTNIEIAEATKDANQEIQALRKMVEELSEDLRNETALKNHLKQQYEQALLRGMSALDLQTNYIQQSVAEQSRAFSDAGQLTYSPHRMSPYR